MLACFGIRVAADRAARYAIGIFSISTDQPAQDFDELEADNGLDQGRNAGPCVSLIDVFAEHQRQICLNKPRVSLAGLAAAQHCCGKFRPADEMQGIACTRRVMYFGSCIFQEYSQTVRDKGLFLEHKDRAADER